MNRKLLFVAFALLACLLCSMSAAAEEAYACYASSNTTLTFYYDDLRSSRTEKTYDMNEGMDDPGWYTDGSYKSVTQVVFDPSFADARPTSMCSWFWGMTNLQSITGMDCVNTSAVTNMSYLFYNCWRLTSLDVSHFNTQNVEDMSGLFWYCSHLTSLDVSSFNTENVTSTSSMFRGCDALSALDLSNFNTENVTQMQYMFEGCRGLKNLDLTNFNTSKVTNMTRMFNDCRGLTTIYVGNGWNTDAVNLSGEMFYVCLNIKGGAGTTYDANHVDKEYAHIDGGTADPGYFTALPVYQAYACYTPDNSTMTFYYDTQRGTRTGTTYDLNTESTAPEWDNGLIWSSVTRVVFDPSFADARPTSSFYWFHNMYKLESITGLQYFNTSEVTNMGSMFSGCMALTSIDLSYFNTANVTTMWYMFLGCSGLTSIDLSSFNTANLENMNSMFYGCTGLTSLDLSNFNTANVISMGAMFRHCTSLTTIYVGDEWSTAAVYSSSNMFLNCSSLVGGQGTTYDANHVDAAYAHIDGGPSNPGYFTAKCLRGDVNQDGRINMSDVIELIHILLTNASPTQGADTDQNGSVNMGDVIELISYLLTNDWPS